MLNESKKILAVGFLLLTSSFSVVHADSALTPMWNGLLESGGLFGNLASGGGLFGSGTTKDIIVPNCGQRVDENIILKQNTVNNVCYPQNLSSNSAYRPTANSYSAYSQNSYISPSDYAYYAQPSYVQPAMDYVTYVYDEPVYVYDYVDSVVTTTYDPYYYQYNQSALAAYSGSNIWYPCDRSGYCNEGLFNTYYRGGRGDVTGFYDDPNLCFDGGPNCGGYPEYGNIDPYIYDQGTYNDNPYVTVADRNTNNTVTYCADCDFNELNNMSRGGFGY